jgi:hypothetical protein
MEYDYSVLRGRIKEKFGSESALASTIGMNRSTFSQKINNQSEFSQQDMIQIMSALEADTGLIGLYFFTPKSYENETKERGIERRSNYGTLLHQGSK